MVTHPLVALDYSSLPWQICSSCQAAYRTSLWHAFSCAAALRVSSLSELEISSKDTSLVTTPPHRLSCSLPLQHQQDPPHPLPRGLHQGMWSGIAPNCRSHCLRVLGIPLGILYQTRRPSLIQMNLSCRNPMCSLSHFMTQSWSLRKRNLISSLESDGLNMGSRGENVMDYVALVRCIQLGKETRMDGWDYNHLHSPPP